MRKALPIKTRMWLGALAFVGVAAAHWLAYLLASPDPHHRHGLLEATGHAYWSYFVALALGALVAGLAGFAAQRLREPEAGPAVTGTLYRFTAARLAALQLAGFVGLEGAERFFSGAEVAGVLAEPAVLIGLALQLLVALVGAALLVVYAGAIDRIARLRARPRAVADISEWLISVVLPPRLDVARGGATLRGPPQHF